MSREVRTTLWIVYLAVVLLMAHAAREVYLVNLDAEHWIEYHDVVPLYESVQVGTFQKFVTTTTVHKDTPLKFNDILYCKDPVTFNLERFNEQNTKNDLARERVKGKTIWPYSPMPSFETECCADHNVTVNPGKKFIERPIRFNGCDKGYYWRVVEYDAD